MRRKSMLPGAILTLLTLVCLLIPGRVTLSVREKVVGWFSPVLRLVSGTPAQAAGDSTTLSPEIKARLAALETQLETDQRILSELRGRPLTTTAPNSAADPANTVSASGKNPLTDRTLGPLGRFLARPIWNGRALYTVDVGSDFGIQIGDGVIAQGGGAGLVVALSPTTATFSPLSYPGVGVQAMVQRSRATGLLTGTGRGLELRYLLTPASASYATPAATEPRATDKPTDKKDSATTPALSAPASPPSANLDPAPGDLIVATGRDGLYPEGTPLGWVETVALETKASGGLRRITVKPWCDPNAADAVRVVPRRPEPIPLPDDPRDLRKRWEALQTANAAAAAPAGSPLTSGTGPSATPDLTHGAAKP